MVFAKRAASVASANEEVEAHAWEDCRQCLYLQSSECIGGVYSQRLPPNVILPRLSQR